MKTDHLRAALTLAQAFSNASLRLAPMPPLISTNSDEGDHYLDITPTGVLLLYAVGRPRSLDLYDTLLAAVGATRTAIEPDGRVTVFTYRFAP